MSCQPVENKVSSNIGGSDFIGDSEKLIRSQRALQRVAQRFFAYGSIFKSAKGAEVDITGRRILGSFKSCNELVQQLLVTFFRLYLHSNRGQGRIAQLVPKDVLMEGEALRLGINAKPQLTT